MPLGLNKGGNMDVSSNGPFGSVVLSRYIGTYNKSIASSLEKLATGLRVGRPSDDSGAFFQAKALDQRAGSLDTITRGLETHIARVKSAEGIMETADTLLAEMSELAKQASTETVQASRTNLGKEFDAKYSALSSLISAARYDGALLFTGSFDSGAGGAALAVQIDEEVTDTYSYDLLDARLSSATGLNLASFATAEVDFGDASNGQTNAGNFYNALTASDAGDVRLERNSNRIQTHLTVLEGALSNLNSKKENYLAASSALVGVDDAAETTRLSAMQIRQQAAASFLTQANLSYGGVINTLSNIYIGK
jgi:flagellin